MNLKSILAKFKSGKALSDEEKKFLIANKDLLNESDAESVEDKLEEEEEDKEEGESSEGDDSEVDEEGVEKLVVDQVTKTLGSASKKAAKAIEEKAEKVAGNLVKAFLKKAEAAAGRKVNLSDDTVKASRQTAEFMKALLTKDAAAMSRLQGEYEKEYTAKYGEKFLETGDAADGGNLIPLPLMEEIMRIRQTQFGLARGKMRYLPMSGAGNTRRIPKLSGSVSVFWTDEAAKKRSTKPQFGLVTQTLKKLAAIVPMTEELLEDSAIDINSLLGELFNEAVAREEDEEFFNGDGTVWTGILQNTSVPSLEIATGTDFEDVTADDLLDLQDEVDSNVLAGSEYYMHRSIFSVVRKLKGTDGHYIYSRPSEGVPAMIWDYPYNLSDAFPARADTAPDTAFILFGNLRVGTVFGDKQQIRVKLLDQATVYDTDNTTPINLAQQDMVALRIVERVGYLVVIPTAMAVLKTPATS